MLIESTKESFRHYFRAAPHPFISESFIELNKPKADQVVRLIQNVNKVSIGLVAGIISNSLRSPFSAPFGGFHYLNENIYMSKIEEFIDDLMNYAHQKNLKDIHLKYQFFLQEQ